MSTLNRGVSYIGACMIVNDKGAIVGETTTGIELSYIEDIMGIWGESYDENLYSWRCYQTKK